MKKPHQYLSPDNYLKALARLQKSIRTGRFTRYTQQKKWQIWNRLCRYARQLGIKIKAPVAAACLAAGLGFVTPLAAQTFTQQTGAANPLNSANTGGFSAPVFVDIDGDGDNDVFMGNYNGTVNYYKNTGTAVAPVFTLQPAASNPLSSVAISGYTFASFVDIDGDGDMDVFIGGASDGTVRYYKNTGTTTAPVFVLQTGLTNPLNSLNDAYYAAPTFVDIDGDGDMDAFLGLSDGTISYYKNTGSATAPVFTLQTAADNPFNLVDIGGYAAPVFVDIDGDGDKDAFIGTLDGTIRYYKNTGTASVPVFAPQVGAANPLAAVNTGNYSAPAFVDIDGDGDIDAFIGGINGTISYYKNTTIVLPLHLLSFNGTREAGYNELQWQTTGEINTKLFELEMSSDGLKFVKINTINATGNNNNIYSTTDKAVYSGKVFYRLKMIDADSRFAYSPVIWINIEKTGGVSIYPNPVTDILNINIGNSGIIKTNAGVYDANGRLLQNILINTNQHQINVQPLARGKYVIKFADGTVQSFIKE
ncbi:MAG: T9SS type A sorting domain-containing protein [Ginsengibacter sp.]